MSWVLKDRRIWTSQESRGQEGLQATGSTSGTWRRAGRSPWWRVSAVSLSIGWGKGEGWGRGNTGEYLTEDGIALGYNLSISYTLNHLCAYSLSRVRL